MGPQPSHNSAPRAPSQNKCRLSWNRDSPWWRHQMETFPRYWPSVRGIHRPRVNSPHKGQWLGTLMFLFDLRLNKRFSKQWWVLWFETLSCPLWHHCSDYRNDTTLRPCIFILGMPALVRRRLHIEKILILFRWSLHGDLECVLTDTMAEFHVYVSAWCHFGRLLIQFWFCPGKHTLGRLPRFPQTTNDLASSLTSPWPLYFREFLWIGMYPISTKIHC